MEWETVIGIELHCELKTKSKMFSASPVAFGEVANTCTNEIDLAFPGTLPSLNKKAVELAVRACMATNSEIDTLVKFDRKNYFYSDLPKGFQITQQFHPIGLNGVVPIVVDGETKNIRLARIHMEEDTAKQTHYVDGTYLDFNRSGLPLIEIVTEADIRSAREAAAYVEKVRTMLYYLDVSDGKMEEGSMRCDVNISIREKGTEKYGTRVEIKNLNSINNVQKAIEVEFERQKEIVEKGEQLVQATMRFDEATRTTIQMRKKEGAVDYKYFPEPNIPPIRLADSWIKSIKENMPELPEQRKVRYLDNYALSDYDVSVLIANKDVSDYYDETMKYTKHAKLTANWITTELLSIINKSNSSILDINMSAENFGSLINMIESNEISGKQAKEIFGEIVDGADPKELIEKRGMKQVSDSSELLKIIIEVLDENPQSIDDYKNGKDRAIGFMVGQVMKKSKGQANPKLTNELLLEELNKR